MRATLLFLTIFIPVVLWADDFEKNYGNGVVHIQADSINSLEFYSAPNSDVTHRLYLTRNAWAVNRTMITFDKLIDSFPPWFATEYFITDGEYARIDIKAVDSANGFYRTTLHDSANREVWVKKSKHVSFYSWLQFYNSVSSIELDSDDLILYKSADPKSKQVNYTPMMKEDERSYMRALEIKGQWMRVELQLPSKDPEKPWQTYTGWIRWRNDRMPLIHYNLMGC